VSETLIQRTKSRTSSLFGLAPCGVCRARGITAAAVRSYRTFSPLPRPVKAEAVYFLWHFPSSDPAQTSAGALPDVIRHTALRSSDFPLPASEDAGSDRPVRLPTESLYVMRGGASGCRLSVSGTLSLASVFAADSVACAGRLSAYNGAALLRKPDAESRKPTS
jgi:hypothetical protein